MTELERAFNAKNWRQLRIHGVSQFAVVAEARRLARELIRLKIRQTGGKLSHYSYRDTTRVVDCLLPERPDIYRSALIALIQRLR